MINSEKIIQKFSRRFHQEKFYIFSSKAQEVEESLRRMAGLDSNFVNDDEIAFVLIPINNPDIVYFGSSCGTVGNTVFSDKSVIKFLKKKKVRFVIGIVDLYDVEEANKKEIISLSSIVLNISEKDGERFEELIYDAEGTFRCDTISVLGKSWSIYESE